MAQGAKERLRFGGGGRGCRRPEQHHRKARRVKLGHLREVGRLGAGGCGLVTLECQEDNNEHATRTTNPLQANDLGSGATQTIANFWQSQRRTRALLAAKLHELGGGLYIFQIKKCFTRLADWFEHFLKDATRFPLLKRWRRQI